MRLTIHCCNSCNFATCTVAITNTKTRHYIIIDLYHIKSFQVASYIIYCMTLFEHLSLGLQNPPHECKLRSYMFFNSIRRVFSLFALNVN